MAIEASEGDFRNFIEEYNDESYLKLIAQFVDQLDVLQKENNILRDQYDFVATVSHQLRTPLTVINFGVDSLEKNVKESDAGRAISESAKELSSIVDTLLFFAEIGGRYSPKSKENLSVKELLSVAMEYSKKRAAAKNISVSVEMPAEDISIKGDMSALKRAVFWFADNGITYG